MAEEKVSNVCMCKCHEYGKPRCLKCRVFHQGITQEKIRTHKHDKANPDIE